MSCGTPKLSVPGPLETASFKRLNDLKLGSSDDADPLSNRKPTVQITVEDGYPVQTVSNDEIRRREPHCLGGDQLPFDDERPHRSGATIG